MTRVRDLTWADFDEVYETFLAKDPLHKTPEPWRLLFQPPWRDPDEPTGYALEDGGRIVGLLGVLRSERIVEGHQHTFRNVHTWFVSQTHRPHSLALMTPLARRRDATITDFSPSPAVVRISRRMGFRELDTTPVVLLPCRTGLETRDGEIVDDDSRLTAAEQRLVFDHRELPCQHLVLVRGNAHCLVVFARVRSRLPSARILHVGDPEMFASFSRLLRRAVGARTGTRFVTVERRLLQGRPVPKSIALPCSVPALFKSDAVAPDRIDVLYSEVLLHGSSALPTLRKGIRQFAERRGLLPEGLTLLDAFRNRFRPTLGSAS